MRQSWTDDRLDDFRGEVNRRFDEVDRRFDKVDRRFDEAAANIGQRFDDAAANVNQRFDEVNRSLDEVNRRSDRFEDRFAAMQRTIMITGGGMIATLVAGILSLIGIAAF